MLRVEDPTDNQGHGWKQMTAEEIASLLYFAIRTLPKRVRSDLYGRDATKADEAARKVANALADRLKACAVFGSARPYEWRGVQLPFADQSRS
ncbi:hypothetical protein [Sphingomonas alba]|uniref:Uncharacterized protein n=1 Tax=Sphingomonas alba TaxID=2908208 RepID=A0ABT0RN08_9SPHN|nr:hypothetical protein [Sphingomonas alba]MCL6683980.1 hypothetical protein [Sphingomonas alba]